MSVLGNQSIRRGVSARKQQEECPYCIMKKKFGIGQERCLEHTVRSQLASTGGNPLVVDPQEMVDMLEDVEEGLSHYWRNMKQITKGDSNKVYSDMQPVLSAIKNVEAQISKFFYDQKAEFEDINPVKVSQSIKKHTSRSEKFTCELRVGSFDSDDEVVTDVIKEWVMHFYKIMTRRGVRQVESPEQQTQYLLPLESEELEMRIFKESMQRKFLTFVSELEKHEKKVQELLGKLIFYMEKSSGHVSTETIQQDIIYIENAGQKHIEPEKHPKQTSPSTNPELLNRLNIPSDKSSHDESALYECSIDLLSETSALGMDQENLKKVLLLQASSIENLLGAMVS